MTEKRVPFTYIRAKPLDMSFENAESLDASEFRVFRTDLSNSHRMLGVPRKFSGRYKTASLLLNGNRLTSLENFRTLAVRMLYLPSALCWLDVSDNRLNDVSIDELSDFPNLRTLYLHRNRLTTVSTVTCLDRLTELRTLRLQHNPLATTHAYRAMVLKLLPRLTNLDFVRVTNDEKHLLPPVLVQQIVNQEKK